MQWINSFFERFEQKPVRFELGRVNKEYFLPLDETLSLIKDREGYNLAPADLSILSKKDKRKLKGRLTGILREAQRMIFDDEVPKAFDKHTGCVRASLLVMYLCRRNGLPCRLVTCSVIKPKVAGYREFKRHMAAECDGWILDAVYGNDYAAKANVVYMAHWHNISGYELTEPWHAIQRNDKLWHYPELIKKEDEEERKRHERQEEV